MNDNITRKIVDFYNQKQETKLVSTGYITNYIYHLCFDFM